MTSDICYSDIGDNICRTENCHYDIGSVPKSTSESIPISDIKEKIIPSGGFEPAPIEKIRVRYTSQLRSCLKYLGCWISGLGQNSMLDSALSVRYQAQSDIADHGYWTKWPPMDGRGNLLNSAYCADCPVPVFSRRHATVHMTMKLHLLSRLSY
jgi:hypothetical protein